MCSIEEQALCHVLQWQRDNDSISIPLLCPAVVRAKKCEVYFMLSVTWLHHLILAATCPAWELVILTSTNVGWGAFIGISSAPVIPMLIPNKCAAWCDANRRDFVIPATSNPVCALTYSHIPAATSISPVLIHCSTSTTVGTLRLTADLLLTIVYMNTVPFTFNWSLIDDDTPAAFAIQTIALRARSTSIFPTVIGIDVLSLERVELSPTSSPGGDQCCPCSYQCTSYDWIHSSGLQW